MPMVSGIELSDADLAGFREVFDLVDKDKSGAIEMEEVEELTQLLGMDLTRDEVELLVREIDKDGNGEVDFEEFYDWWTSDKESSVLKKAQDGNQKDYEIEPY